LALLSCQWSPTNGPRQKKQKMGKLEVSQAQKDWDALPKLHERGGERRPYCLQWRFPKEEKKTRLEQGEKGGEKIRA